MFSTLVDSTAASRVAAEYMRATGALPLTPITGVTPDEMAPKEDRPVVLPSALPSHCLIIESFMHVRGLLTYLYSCINQPVSPSISG